MRSVWTGFPAAAALVIGAAAADLAVEIPPVRTSVTIQNQAVAVLVSARVSLRQDGAERLAEVTLAGDLGDLQDKLPDILRAELNQENRCGNRLSITGVSLVPDAPSSVLRADFHYEKFACAKAFGKEIVKRLAAGNGTMRVRLSPEVEAFRSVRLKAEVLSLDGDGQLAEILHAGEFGEALQEKIRKTVAADLEKSADFGAALPESIREAAVIRSAEFTRNRDGRLGLAIAGELHVTEEQAAAIANRVK